MNFDQVTRYLINSCGLLPQLVQHLGRELPLEKKGPESSAVALAG